MPSWLPIAASSVLAIIPVVIWLRVIAREGEDKSLYIKTFLIGTFSVVPPFILLILFERNPDLDFYAKIQDRVQDAALIAIYTNVIVAIIEELAKNAIVRFIDRRHPEFIQTIGSALKLSICAGLGFSFAENIFYFYNIWVNYGFADLFSAFIFRSLFTMMGHMIFSGIFGYYFGLGKFSADLTEMARWEGKGFMITRLLSRLTGKMMFEVYRMQKNLTGLFLALILHASFNASLDLQHKLPSILIIVISAAYIAYLLQRKTGAFYFSVLKRRASTMAPNDEDVVLELLGMWTKEGKYDEVMKICDRLLSRDPDNNVVKLFKAKAADNAELRGVYNSLKAVFEKEKIQTQKSEGIPGGPAFGVQDEKTVLEVMDMWYKEGKYKETLDIANKLLARNPKSEGAKVLLQKAMDKEKMRHLFDSLSKLFTD